MDTPSNYFENCHFRRIVLLVVKKVIDEEVHLLCFSSFTISSTLFVILSLAAVSTTP